MLRIDVAYVNDATNAMLVIPSSPLSGNVTEVGQYLTNKISIPPVYQTLFENNRTLGEQTELIESITTSYEINSDTLKEQYVLSLKLFSGQSVRIINPQKGLKSKVNLMIKTHSQLFTYIGKDFKVQDEVIVLKYDDLCDCTIEIANYLHPSRQNECYYKIFLN